jgi:hypothetical protein
MTGTMIVVLSCFIVVIVALCLDELRKMRR